MNLPRYYGHLRRPDYLLEWLTDAPEIVALVKRLHANGIVDWHLEGRQHLTPAEYTEYLFLQDILESGIAIQQLPRLLKGLEKPYLYSHEQIYYNFGLQRWDVKHHTPEPLTFSNRDYYGPPPLALVDNQSLYTLELDYTTPRQDVFMSDAHYEAQPNIYFLQYAEPFPTKRIRRIRPGEVFRVG